MFYTLMHKNNPVAETEIDSASGYIAKLRDVFDPRRLPVGVGIEKGVIDRKALNDYMRLVKDFEASLSDY